MSDHEIIAHKFGLTYQQLSALVYPSINHCYNTFVIPKKSGEERIIHSPKFKLLTIQRIIADELIERHTPRICAHGFIKNRSIVSNAERHINKIFVFNIDLENFFGSIHFGRVKNLLKSHPFDYSDAAATILAHICCVNNKLPQGAPTSPILSNMICWKLDKQLQQLAKEHKCTYSRYADDLTFSFNCSRSKLPKALVDFDENNIVSPGGKLAHIILSNGFSINHKKVRLQDRSKRQEVTGITVNRGTNLKRAYIKQTFSMMFGSPVIVRSKFTIKEYELFALIEKFVIETKLACSFFLHELNSKVENRTNEKMKRI